jgi:hypothetical protein
MMSENTHLYVLWTNDNLITAEKMVFMYTVNPLVHGDVTALLNDGILTRTDKGRIVFPYDAVKADLRRTK